MSVPLPQLAADGWRRIAAAHAALLLASLTFSAWNVIVEVYPQRQGGAMLLCTLRDGIALIILELLHRLRVLALRLRRAPGGEPRCSVDAAALIEGSDGAASGGLREPAGPRDRADWALLVLVGVSGPYVGPLATLFCVAWSSADTCGILNALTPLVASCIAVAGGFERATWLLAVGLVAGVAAGILSVGATASGPQSGGTAVGFGIVAGMVGACGQGTFFVAAKPLLREKGEWQPMAAYMVIRYAYFVAFVASLLTLLVAAAVWGSAKVAGNLDTTELWLALYSGIICAAVNFTLIMWANKILPASVCALYSVMQPPMTAVIAWLVKGEKLVAIGYLSMCLALVSLLIVSFDRERQASASNPAAASASCDRD